MYNIIWGSNAKDQKEALERKEVLKNYLNKIENTMGFLESYPDNLMLATKYGFNPYKIDDNIYVLHLSKSYDFTYIIDGKNVIIVDIRNRYQDLSFYNCDNYPDLDDVMIYIKAFYDGDISYKELFKRYNYYHLHIEAVDSSNIKSMKEAMEMMKRVKEKRLLPSDIILLSIVYNKEKVFISRDMAKNIRFTK